MAGFLRQLLQLWRRQARNWQIIVTHQVTNRFLVQLADQYTNIFIRMLGASPVELGWVRSSSGVAAALVSVPLGIVQDRYSLRRIYLFGISLLAVVPLIYATATRWEYLVPAIFLMGLAQRFGSCSVICDVSLRNRDRATARAMCEGVGASPTLFAPLLGAFLVTLFGGMTLEGIRPLFWIQFVIRIALVTYVFKSMTEVIRDNGDDLIPEETGVLSWIGALVREGRAVPQCLAFLALSFVGKTLLLTFMYPFAHEIKGAGALVIGGITAAMTLSEGLFAAIFGRLADTLGRKRTYYMLAPLAASGTILMAFSPTSSMLLMAGFLLGFRVIAEVLLSSLPAELVPTRYIGRWRGVIGLFMGLVAIPAPILGGYLWERVGPHYVFLAIAALDLFLVLPLVTTLPETADTGEKG